MDQHIIGPLQEGGVDGHHGKHPLLGQATTHGHSMAFRNTYVKKSLRKPTGKFGQSRTLFHSRGDGTDPPIPVGHGTHCFSKGVREGLLMSSLGSSRLNIEAGNAMEFIRILLGVAVSSSLGGGDMEQNRASQFFGLAQQIGHFFDVVTIYRPQIDKAHLIKHITPNQRIFHPQLNSMNYAIQILAPGNCMGKPVEQPLKV